MSSVDFDALGLDADFVPILNFHCRIDNAFRSARQKPVEDDALPSDDGDWPRQHNFGSKVKHIYVHTLLVGRLGTDYCCSQSVGAGKSRRHKTLHILDWGKYLPQTIFWHMALGPSQPNNQPTGQPSQPALIASRDDGLFSVALLPEQMCEI